MRSCRSPQWNQGGGVDLERRKRRRTFNRRAIRVYERVGFSAVPVFTHWTNVAEWQFVEMEGPAWDLRLSVRNHVAGLS